MAVRTLPRDPPGEGGAKTTKIKNILSTSRTGPPRPAVTNDDGKTPKIFWLLNMASGPRAGLPGVVFGRFWAAPYRPQPKSRPKSAPNRPQPGPGDRRQNRPPTGPSPAPGTGQNRPQTGQNRPPTGPEDQKPAKIGPQPAKIGPGTGQNRPPTGPSPAPGARKLDCATYN
jgi:hypothetical protein